VIYGFSTDSVVGLASSAEAGGADWIQYIKFVPSTGPAEYYPVFNALFPPKAILGVFSTFYKGCDTNNMFTDF